MSENLNEDLQKFEELERLLEDAEVKSDEVEEEVEEATEDSTDVESGDDDAVSEEDDSEDEDEDEDDAVSEEDDSEDEDEAEAEEDSSDDDEGEEADDSEEEVDVVEKVANALEAQTKDADEDEDEAEAEEEDAEEADESEEAEESEEADDTEESEEDDEVSEKAASIMARMAEEETVTDMPMLWFKESALVDAEEDYEIIPEAKYMELDDDAKEAYEAVQVFEEGTGKGYGMRYRRRSPLERDSRRKDDEVIEDAEEKAEMPKDMFETAAEATARAAEIGCEGSHQHSDGMFMPCASMEAYQTATGGEKSEDFLCGQQRKSVQQPCDVCRGGCAPEEGLPGLQDIELIVKDAYSGSEIIGSGYSNVDDMFVIDIKREDGSAIEVFLSGEGEELGWLRLDDDLIDGKSLEGIEVITKSDAEEVAVKALESLDAKGEVMGVMVDVFADEDVYVVEIDGEEKSYDFFVGIDGKVLGYDEYEVESTTELAEEDEIKALEAELEIKRMYSREQRQSMAESGEALPDGSFPISDAADLENALAALPRAKDQNAAAAHILKRATELGIEERLPEGFAAAVRQAEGNSEAEVPEAPEAEAPAAPQEGAEKAAIDEEMLSALEEFESLKLEEEEGLS